MGTCHAAAAREMAPITRAPSLFPAVSMFSNWFSETAAPNAPQGNGSPTGGRNDDAKGDASSPLDPSILPGVSLSPHDAAVEEVVAKMQDLKEASSPEDAQIVSPETGGTQSLPKNIYDPFDGQTIGLVHPGRVGKAETEIWDHLAQVRDLQSEIARMHAQMEGLGDADNTAANRQTASDDQGLNADEEAKVAQSAEFARLSDRFNERKEAVETIMLKVSRS